jgi:hypothetical protein
VRTANGLFRVRYTVNFSVLSLALLLHPFYTVQGGRRSQISPTAPPPARMHDVSPEPRPSQTSQSEPRRSEPGPQPPCGNEPTPPYPPLDDPAIVKSWSEASTGRDWRPPACTGWAAEGFTTLVTTVARFRNASEAEGLLRRVGAISELKGMRYWSTTHKRWRTLVVDAYALDTSQAGQRRKDFTPDEMKPGNVLYFEQVDNLSGKAAYRMHIATVSANRLVIDIENVSTMRYLLVPILHPGEMQSICFLDRESEGVWRYYSIVRTGRNANRLIAGNQSSAVNRAVAFYRHVVGIPTDQDPPAAP